MIAFRPGDRIKMTERYATTLMLSKKARLTVNWHERRGVVTSGNTSSCFIKWNDRRTLDQHPNGAIELDVNAS